MKNIQLVYPETHFSGRKRNFNFLGVSVDYFTKTNAFGGSVLIWDKNKKQMYLQLHADILSVFADVIQCGDGCFHMAAVFPIDQQPMTWGNSVSQLFLQRRVLSFLSLFKMYQNEC